MLPKPRITYILLTVLLIGGLVCLSALGDKYSSRTLHNATAFAIVVDAGSTHSNFLVYTWTPRPANVTAADLVESPRLSQHKFDCEARPGISSFGANPAGLRANLQPCLDAAVRALPHNSVAATPFFLRATAGMRILEADNANAAAAVLASISSLVASTRLNHALSSALILPGTVEGASGWVTVNFLNGTLSAPPLVTAGALDLGGASTQITFAAPAGQGANLHFDLFGVGHDLQTQSYLCYGLNAAEQRLNASLLANQSALVSESGVLRNPCLPAGFNTSLGMAQIAFLPTDVCTRDTPVPFVDRDVVVVGTGDVGTCAALMVSLVRGGPDPVAPVSDIAGNFFAFAGYFHFVDFLCTKFGAACAITPNGWRPSLFELQESLMTLCIQPWVDLQPLDPSLPTGILANTCLSGQFATTLLIEGYGFPVNSSRIEFVSGVQGADVGWAFGWMLNQTNTLLNGPGLPVGHRNMAPALFWSFFIPLSLAVLVLTVVLLRTMTRLRRAKEKLIQYQPL